MNDEQQMDPRILKFAVMEAIADLTEANANLAKAEATIKNMRVFVSHHFLCEIGSGQGGTPCNCGLGSLLAELKRGRDE